MTVFGSVTEADVRRVITASPSKSSTLDLIPTFLLKEVLEQLLPFITALVNASLPQGRLPLLSTTVRPQSTVRSLGVILVC